MNIHIRGTVEFEKILSQPWANSIETTRVRMAVQQLLDTQESTAHLRKQLKAYIAKSDELVHHLSKHWDQPLIEQPSFEWCVNDAMCQAIQEHGVLCQRQRLGPICQFGPFKSYDNGSFADMLTQ